MGFDREVLRIVAPQNGWTAVDYLKDTTTQIQSQWNHHLLEVTLNRTMASPINVGQLSQWFQAWQQAATTWFTTLGSQPLLI
jgi:hypothetical protein